MSQPNLTDRRGGRGSVPLGALAVGHLETHLFAGNRALIGNGTEFLLVSAPGVKQPNTTKTGVTLAVQIARCASPILLESVGRNKMIPLSRVLYRRKYLLTFSVSTLLAPIESYDLVFNIRHLYSATLRPAFSHFISLAWELDCATLSIVCRLEIGVRAHAVGVARMVPVPVMVVSSLFFTMTAAYVLEFPLRDVAHYTMPLLAQVTNAAWSIWNQPVTNEWAILIFLGVYCGHLWRLRMWGVFDPFISDPRLPNCIAQTPLGTDHSFGVTGGGSCVGRRRTHFG